MKEKKEDVIEFVDTKQVKIKSGYCVICRKFYENVKVSDNTELVKCPNCNNMV